MIKSQFSPKQNYLGFGKTFSLVSPEVVIFISSDAASNEIPSKWWHSQRAHDAMINVIMTSKRRRFEVIMTLLFYCVPSG